VGRGTRGNGIVAAKISRLLLPVLLWQLFQEYTVIKVVLPLNIVSCLYLFY